MNLVFYINVFLESIYLRESWLVSNLYTRSKPEDKIAFMWPVVIETLWLSLEKISLNIFNSFHFLTL